MKVVVGYPPLASSKGVPLLSQNRQFQWFSVPTYIYPVIPASAATMAANEGHDILWLDGIAQEMSFQDWMQEIVGYSPDIILIETKTPVIANHWEIVHTLKHKLPHVKIVLVGDHVTALPQESFDNSPVDYILTGGNYDFLFTQLLDHLTSKKTLPPGVWYREGKKVINTGVFVLHQKLDEAPLIDRDLTKWHLYAVKNGNFRKTPGTYIMAGRDCWWRKNGGCTFCSWTTLYPQFQTRSVSSVLDEIGYLIENYHVKEIMDDTGTLPVGKWLGDFCRGMIERGYHKQIYFDCNMRFGILKKEEYILMAKAGFRFLLYGLESANQSTLDRLNKGTDISTIEKELTIIQEANLETQGQLEPHVTCMVGYPWETEADAEKTIAFTKDLFKKRLISTLQATVVIPYPGTKLFKECERNEWLKTHIWNEYDMKQPVMKSPISDAKLLSLTQSIYTSFITPRFIISKLLSIRNLSDVIFLGKAGIRVIGHLLDFKK